MKDDPVADEYTSGINVKEFAFNANPFPGLFFPLITTIPSFLGWAFRDTCVFYYCRLSDVRWIQQSLSTELVRDIDGKIEFFDVNRNTMVTKKRRPNG